jgi:exodeoxyribonuclease VII small subunit
MAQRKRSTSEPSFEDSLQKLEAIVRRLEEEEIPLEQSLKLFAEGQTLARSCDTQLKAAENQIRQLLEKGSGQIVETNFNTGESPASDAEAEADSDDDDSDEDDADNDANAETESTPPARPKKLESDRPLERDPDDLPF